MPTLEWIENEKARLKDETNRKILALTAQLNRKLDMWDKVAYAAMKRQPLAGSVAE